MKSFRKEDSVRKLITKIKHSLSPWRGLKEQNCFILNELQRINEKMRYQQLEDSTLLGKDVLQTLSSFDYQWHEIPQGVGMPDDQTFMKKIESLICRMTDLAPDWFSGKKVADVGCGVGRFSYGFLSLNAWVTACDQSLAALQRTKELCQRFAERLSTKQINLLEWNEEEEYDLVFCFGVVHHTGNSYLAIRNAAQRVKKGGRLFLMVYGFPMTLSDMSELNRYEALRRELRNCSLDERKKRLTKKFGAVLTQGWFDAVSPRINDLLTFEEGYDLLTQFGFKNIKRTMPGRNHHMVADHI